MTREEKIKHIVQNYTIKTSNNYYSIDLETLVKYAFESGIKWADEHPQSSWISVKDDLPCNHKELTPKDYTVEVLALDDCNFYRVVRMWDFNEKWIWGIDDLPITHWMRLPELPKE